MFTFDLLDFFNTACIIRFLLNNPMLRNDAQSKFMTQKDIQYL